MWEIVERLHRDGSLRWDEVPCFVQCATKEEAEARMKDMTPKHGGRLLVKPVSRRRE